MTRIPPGGMLDFASSREGLREIAARQRAILLCILANMVV